MHSESNEMPEVVSNDKKEQSKNRTKLTVKEIVLFGMLGGLMYASKAAMAALPNMHLIGVFIIAITVVFRFKALYPIYIYVLLEGIFGGFTTWWVPYLYVWTVLWGITMLLPKKMKKPVAVAVYMVVCAFHGLIFGTLFAPAQALFFGLNFRSMLAWIAAGLPFDVTHCVSNFFLGILICPLISVLKQADKLGRE